MQLILLAVRVKDDLVGVEDREINRGRRVLCFVNSFHRCNITHQCILTLKVLLSISIRSLGCQLTHSPSVSVLGHLLGGVTMGCDENVLEQPASAGVTLSTSELPVYLHLQAFDLMPVVPQFLLQLCYRLPQLLQLLLSVLVLMEPVRDVICTAEHVWATFL